MTGKMVFKIFFVVSILLVFVIGFSGCTGLGRFAPRTLDSSPEDTGLLVISCELYGKGFFNRKKVKVNDVYIGNLEDTENLLKGAIIGKGIVMFHALPPGDYRLAKLYGFRSGFSASGSYWCVLPPREEFIVKIEAGVPNYLGHLCISAEYIIGTKANIEWNDDKQFEIAAWEKVLEWYPVSPWSGLITQRIDELE